METVLINHIILIINNTIKNTKHCDMGINFRFLLNPEKSVGLMRSNKSNKQIYFLWCIVYYEIEIDKPL